MLTLQSEVLYRQLMVELNVPRERESIMEYWRNALSGRSTVENWYGIGKKTRIKQVQETEASQRCQIKYKLALFLNINNLWSGWNIWLILFWMFWHIWNGYKETDYVCDLIKIRVQRLTELQNSLWYERMRWW